MPTFTAFVNGTMPQFSHIAGYSGETRKKSIDECDGGLFQPINPCRAPYIWLIELVLSSTSTTSRLFWEGATCVETVAESVL